ncbi:MAG TPA: carboxypeptidase-like regulatory domain-containing protein, partial [Terriglobales bacterium]|nr:carboxypeptidase-like regulatory domain-containing protein [Terriglobales bacterium]
MRSIRLTSMSSLLKGFSQSGLLIGILVLTFLTAISGRPAYAQQATASVNGTVSDPSGALVTGAKVTLKNLGTNVARTVTTNKDGEYLFPSMPIGTYELSVEQAGFSKYVQTGITLQINENARQNVSLRVGSAAETVEVQGNVTQVDTVSATIG